MTAGAEMVVFGGKEPKKNQHEGVKIKKTTTTHCTQCVLKQIPPRADHFSVSDAPKLGERSSVIYEFLE